ETTTYEYPPEDRSWELELEDFASAIEQGREPCGNLEDAAAVLEIAGKLYGAGA
ncbi:MAG: LmbZ, partial [Candidatus Rokuibacteriota bacterium]